MMYNALTPKQMELLFMLAEEAGEVIQVVNKTLRHGLHEGHPDGSTTNKQDLGKEIGDLIAVINAAKGEGIVSFDDIRNSASTKMARAAQYLHHQGQ
jgi:NTP pyrophosphatase (non-canonical NTP hydrolase)